MFFNNFRNPGFIVDILGDLVKLNKMALDAKKTGMIILGGGLIKHHICNANLMRNGADFSVYINTAQEFDGSDSGARPDEAVSWGKIKVGAKSTKVYAEISLVTSLSCTIPLQSQFRWYNNGNDHLLELHQYYI